MTPSIGRILWFYPKGHERSGQPLASIITYVHSDKLVNLASFDQSGNQQPGATSVSLVENETERDAFPTTIDVAMWMPYQVTQAAKFEKPIEPLEPPPKEEPPAPPPASF